MSYIAITIDTSIFDRYQCQLLSGILSELSQFNGMPTKVVLSEVVVRELKGHIQKRIESTKSAALRVLTECGKELLTPRDTIQKVTNELKLAVDSSKESTERIQAFQKLTGAEIVQVEGNVELKTIVSKYFSAEPPFAESGKKKNEFPDAFALMSLENWAEKNGGLILAISSDKDWVAYAQTSKHLDCVEDLAEALARFQPSNDAVAYCETLSNVLERRLDHPVREAIEDAITRKSSEIDLWAEADSQFHVEGEHVELEISEVSLSDNTRVIPLQAQEHRLTIKARFLVESVATADFSFSIYDSIDKDYTNMGDIQADCEFDFEIEAMIELSGDFARNDEDVVVESIQLISSPHTVDFGYIEPAWMSEPDV